MTGNDEYILDLLVARGMITEEQAGTARTRGEQEDLSDRNFARTQELANELKQWQELMRAVAITYKADGQAQLDEKQMERLRSLGYVE